MILFLGPSSDTIILALAKELDTRGQSWMLVNPNDAIFESQFTWHVGKQFHLQLSSAQAVQPEISSSSLKAILWRSQFPLSPPSPENWEPQDFAYMAKEGYAALMGLLQGSKCPIINPPIPGGRSRFFFADSAWRSLLNDHSIGLPAMSLVTSTMEATKFIQEMPENIRIVPLATTNSKEMIQYSEGYFNWDFSTSPLCLQSVSPGEWFHLISVGPEVRGGPIEPQIGPGSFVTGVNPQSCPSPLIANCLALGKAFELEFSESLWMKDAFGQWSCLDWNSVPQIHHWSPTMQQEVQPLLAKLLIEKNDI